MTFDHVLMKIFTGTLCTLSKMVLHLAGGLTYVLDGLWLHWFLFLYRGTPQRYSRASTKAGNEEANKTHKSHEIVTIIHLTG